MILLPICFRMLSPRSNASLLPPTIKVSVPPLAPPTPPETGASRDRAPYSPAISCARRALPTSIVDESITSAPLAISGKTSLQTLITCLPAGNIVTKVWASLIASIALCASEIPAFAAAARASSPRSKPETSKPALTRLAAIGPPILPRPIKAIFFSFTFFLSLFWEKRLIVCWQKQRRDRRLVHILQIGGRPAWLPVLIDDRSPHPLVKIMPIKQARSTAIFVDKACFQIGCEACKTQKPQSEFQAGGRFPRDRIGCGYGELGTVLQKSRKDVFHIFGLHGCIDDIFVRFEPAGHWALSELLKRPAHDLMSGLRAEQGQGFPDFWQVRRGNKDVREACINSVARRYYF